jgi:Flp pilus assembly protein TadD
MSGDSSEHSASSQKLAAAIAHIATAEYLRTKFLDIGGQFEEMLKTDRESVTVDLSELAEGLSAQGTRVSAEHFRWIVTATQIDGLVTFFHTVRTIRPAAFTAAVILLVGNLAFGTFRRDFGAIGGTFITIAAMSFSTLCVLFPLSWLAAKMPPPWPKLIASISTHLQLQFGLVAAGALLLGAGFIILNRKVRDSRTAGEQTSVILKNRGSRPALITAGLTILFAAVGSYFVSRPQSNQQGQVLEPSGPVIQVPSTLLFSGAGRGTVSLTSARVTVDQVGSIQRALRQNPHDAKILNNAGVIYRGIGQPEEGNRLLSEAVKAAPNDPIINYNYANGLYQDGNVKEAGRYADVAISADARFDEARLLRAATAVQQRDFDTASEQISKLVNKGLSIAYIIDGVIKLFKGKFQEALMSFQSALKMTPNDPTALYNSGVASQRQNNQPTAENFYRQAIATHQAPAEAHDNLGIILANSGNIDAALGEFREAVFLRPDKTFRDHLKEIYPRATAISSNSRMPVETKQSQSPPPGYAQLPPANRTTVGIGSIGAGRLTVINSSEHVLEMAIRGPTTNTLIIPPYLSNTVSIADGQYRLIARSPDDPKIRPFYGSELYRGTEHYSIEMEVIQLAPTPSPQGTSIRR